MLNTNDLSSSSSKQQNNDGKLTENEENCIINNNDNLKPIENEFIFNNYQIINNNKSPTSMAKTNSDVNIKGIILGKQV